MDKYGRIWTMKRERCEGCERQHGLKPILHSVILPSEYFVNFTTGFGLRPSPAAIIVTAPSGPNKKKTVNGYKSFLFCPFRA